MAAPAAAAPARAEQVEAPAPPAAPEDNDRPVHDPFELDEKSDDPQGALDSMKHNCCDEMPAQEQKQHLGK